MSLLEALLIGLAGLAAGTINTVVGSGTLITFPTLLAFGVPPVTANVSNTIGLVPGSVSGAIGYRRELAGQRPRVLRLAVASLIGGLAGARPAPGAGRGRVRGDRAGADRARAGPGRPPAADLGLGGQRATSCSARTPRGVTGAWWVWPGVLVTGVYGGYFGAAQGVLLMAVMGIGIQETLQRLNGVKNVLALLVNAVAGVLFVFVADVDWQVVALIGVGSVIGGQLGATVGRRLPDTVLRGAIVVVGLTALAVFLFAELTGYAGTCLRRPAMPWRRPRPAPRRRAGPPGPA